MGLLSFLRSQKIRMSKQHGFSLVELMVVVAIIGILASIAIPNYQRFQRKARQSEPKTVLAGIYTAQKVFNTEWGFGTTDLSQMGFDLEAGSNPVYNTGWNGQETSGDWNAVNCAATCTGNVAQYRGPRAGATAFTNTGEQVTQAANSKPATMQHDIDNSFPGGACACDPASTALAACQLACAVDTTGSACDDGAGGSAHGDCGFAAGLGGRAVPGDDNDNFNTITFTIGSIGNIGGGDPDAWTMSDQKALVNVQNGL